MNFMNQVDVPKPILQKKESQASYLGGIIDRARSKLQEVSSSEFSTQVTALNISFMFFLLPLSFLAN